MLRGRVEIFTIFFILNDFLKTIPILFEASLVTQTVKNLPAMHETWIQSLDREDPPGKGMATPFSILALKSHGQRSLVGYSPWGGKESDTTE